MNEKTSENQTQRQKSHQRNKITLAVSLVRYSGPFFKQIQTNVSEDKIIVDDVQGKENSPALKIVTMRYKIASVDYEVM